METERRYLLQTHLETVTGLPESRVHFQPPNGMQLDFANGIVTYSRNRAEVDFADNLPYRSAMGYTVTVIHKDPDNDIRSKIAALRYCKFDRWYAADGLNHDVYTLFF